MLAYGLDFTQLTPNGMWSQRAYIQLFQHLIVYSGVILIFFLIFSVIINVVAAKNIKFQVIYDIMKVTNLVIVSILFLFIFFKFLITLFYLPTYSNAISMLGSNDIELKFFLKGTTLTLNGSILSDIILILAYSSGMVCIYLLGEKNSTKYISNISLFVFFYLAIIVMVYTTNLLVMFVGFECLFLPTLFFVKQHGYVKKVDKTLTILVYWTLCGAFLVLSTLGYLFYKYKTLNVYMLSSVPFSSNEKHILYLALFLGFGVKVPIFPFHYWLTKIHVEAPAGFSIFLSGFLVKAAIYCFYFFNYLFQSSMSLGLATTVTFFAIVESSIKMWNQTDFKKLIAFATIQEMNLILFLLLNCQNTMSYTLILFILIHGWLSTLMFYLVDIIQKKTTTRNIVLISGLAYTFPAIKFVIWLIIILFSGFPLTVKFSIEWQLLALLASRGDYVMLVVFFFVIVIGTVGFVKQMFIILYGMPRKDLKINNQLSRKDKYLLYFICSLLIFLNILNFFIG